MFKTTGFTLVEVLVALVILSGGLLGLAALQTTTLSNNQSAYNRSQATQLAYDIVDRMRANLTEAQLLANSQYAVFVPNPPFPSNPNCYATTGCTTTVLAQNDLNEWNNAIAATLPGCGYIIPSCGSNSCGSIAVNGTLYTITIKWDDNRDGDIDGDCGTGQGDIDGDGDTDNDPSFQMSIGL